MKPKKNICIVTWFGSPNFGTNLQACALREFLRKNSYGVKIISQLPPFSDKEKLLQYYLFKFKPYRVWLRIKRLFHKGNESFYTHFFGNPAINRWVRSNLKPTILNFPHEIRQLVKKTDCFITGSDQVWNTYVGFDPTMFLNFAKTKKKISYASSIGTKNINPIFKDEVKKLLLQFSHISMREPLGALALQKLLNSNEIASVIDPTLLLSQQEWISFCHPYKKFPSQNKSYIFCYLIGNNKNYEQTIRDIWKRSKIDNLIIVPSCENPNFSVYGSNFARNISPPEFVWLLNNAKLICTDSFHATALSINLRKQFVELLRFSDTDETSQNSRIHSILGHYNLNNQLYKEGTTNWLKEINYTAVHKILNDDRRKAISWLLNSIEN